MLTVEERVKAGTALLDEKKPRWSSRISVPSLDMRYCDSCVLGHTYGSLSHGLNQLGIQDGDRRIDFGFTSTYTDKSPTRSYDKEMIALQVEWIKEIKARTKVATPE